MPATPENLQPVHKTYILLKDTVKVLRAILNDDFEAHKHDWNESVEDWPDRLKAEVLVVVMAIVEIVTIRNTKINTTPPSN